MLNAKAAKRERMVSEFDRILVAYGERQNRVVDELMAELEATPEERARLRVVAQLVQTVVHTFGTLETDWATLPARGFVERRSPSPLPAAPQQLGETVNMSVRSLVDSGALTAWQARCINLNLGLKRTVFLCGSDENARSTLLNALLGLLQGTQRLVVVDGEEGRLPIVKERSGIMQIAAAGMPAREEAFREAVRTRPDWIVVRELEEEDGPSYLDSLHGSCGGVGTLRAEQAGATFDAWIVKDRKCAQRLVRLKPLILHLKEAKDDRPGAVELLEATVRDGRTVLTPHTGLS